MLLCSFCFFKGYLCCDFILSAIFNKKQIYLLFCGPDFQVLRFQTKLLSFFLIPLNFSFCFLRKAIFKVDTCLMFSDFWVAELIVERWFLSGADIFWKIFWPIFNAKKFFFDMKFAVTWYLSECLLSTGWSSGASSRFVNCSGYVFNFALTLMTFFVLHDFHVWLLTYFTQFQLNGFIIAAVSLSVARI